MADAQLKVISAGPLVTVQDGGRIGHMRYGVPASGPMDRLSHAAANTVLGNSLDASAIEVSNGGLCVECVAGAITVSITGGAFNVDHAGSKSGSWQVLTLQSGERLTIRAGKLGSWAYLAFGGEMDAPRWLDHTATHALSGFGGGSLSSGQEIRLKDAAVDLRRHGPIPEPKFWGSPSTARVVMGPQDQHFQSSAIEAFLNTPYRLTENFDRMGVRLEGAKLTLTDALSIPSEPIVRGSVQVAGDGVPTVLLADHQTTGGYPKIATIISPDIDQLVQMRPGDTLRFQAIDPPAAISIARSFAEQSRDYLETLTVPRGDLEHRLMSQNLISGVVSE